MSVSPASSQVVSVTVNGKTYERDVPARRLLVHLLRDDLDLTGTHVGCDTGSCGACTVTLDGVAVKSCSILAVQADGASITTVEGLAEGDELTRAAAVVPRAPRAAVRLLHARDADERHRAAREQPVARPRRTSRSPCRGTSAAAPGTGTSSRPWWPPGRGVPHDGRRDRRHDAAEGRHRQSVPRKEDNRLVQGQGTFFDDVKRHGMGYLHFVRSPYAHARITSIDVSSALEMPGVYGTLTGDEVAISHRSVLPDRRAARRARQGLRARRRQGALPRRGRRRRRRRDPRARTRRRRAGLVDYEPLDVVVDARRALEPDAPVLHEECGGNMSYSGVVGVGRRRRRLRRGRPRRHDLRAALRPLQLDAARDRRRARRVQPRHRPVDDLRRTTSSPASR